MSGSRCGTTFEESESQEIDLGLRNHRLKSLESEDREFTWRQCEIIAGTSCPYNRKKCKECNYYKHAVLI